MRIYNLDVKVARLFNTYGPMMRPDDGRVVSNFIIQALTNKNITVYGKGQQTRSFCYIDDLVSGILLMMNCENFSGPINLGNPVEISILELAQEVIELTGSSSKIIYKELPIDDPQMRCPDITMAREKLNWTPKYDRKLGLEKTIKYFESLMREGEI